MIPKRTPKRVTGSSPWQNRRPGLARISRSSRSSAFSFPSRAGAHRPVSVGAPPGLRSASGSLTPRANRRGHRAIPTRQRGRSEADTTRPPHDGAPRDTSMDDPSGDLLSLVSHQDQVSTKPGQLQTAFAIGHTTPALASTNSAGRLWWAVRLTTTDRGRYQDVRPPLSMLGRDGIAEGAERVCVESIHGAVYVGVIKVTQHSACGCVVPASPPSPYPSCRPALPNIAERPDTVADRSALSGLDPALTDHVAAIVNLVNRRYSLDLQSSSPLCAAATVRAHWNWPCREGCALWCA